MLNWTPRVAAGQASARTRLAETAAPAPAVSYRVLDAYARYNETLHRPVRGRLRYAVNRIASEALGAVVPLLGRRHGDARSCDVLFLHGWSQGEAWCDTLTRALRDHGLSAVHRRREDRKSRLRERSFDDPGMPVPRRWRLDTWYAAHLLEVHQPRVIVVFDNSSPFISCLRRVARNRATVVNIAHSVMPTDESANMFDVDYYLVFGASSVEKARRKALRIGSTKLVTTGSIFFTPALALPQTLDRRSLLFFSALSRTALSSPLVSSATVHRLIDCTRLVLEFAARNPQYRLHIKQHPLEEPGLLSRLAALSPNVTILPIETTIRDALALTSLSLVMWSNAALESALLQRPVVMVDVSAEPDDYLELERFFQPRARTPQELATRVASAYAEYDGQLAAGDAFVQYHLARRLDGAQYAADVIASIIRGGPAFSEVPVEQNLDGLRSRAE